VEAGQAQPCTVGELLLRRAMATPGARAVALEGVSRSYEELARDALGIAVGHPVSGCRLWAFAAGESLSMEALGETLRRSLPPHMLPERIELRPSLPRTSTGSSTALHWRGWPRTSLTRPR